jgi:uncharacterized protein (TIGR03437 family)
MKKLINPLLGSLMSRRDSLRLIGAASATALVGRSEEQIARLLPANPIKPHTPTTAVPGILRNALFTPAPRATWDTSQTSCVTRPALTEGPFFVDELLNRSDIRPDPANGTVKAGTPLKVKFNVGKVSGSSCAALAGAYVDLWHCDATGGYSDVSGQGNPNNQGQKFLRGYQVTDNNGAVEFTTVYPGWYSGRTVHMHYKVRLFAGAALTYEFTSQVCFDDTLTDQVFTASPYSARPNRNTRNSNDMIYQSGGTILLLDVAGDGAGGYTTTYNIGITNVPESVAGIASVSAASFTGLLASDSIAALFGTGLATTTAAATSTALPTELGGITVTVLDANGVRRTAPLFFVSPTQVNFQMPSATSAGPAVIYVQRNGTVVGQGAATVATVAPGLFSANASGQGVAAAVVLRIKDGVQSFEPVAQFNTATNRFEAVPIDLGGATEQVFLVAFGGGFRNRSALSAVSAAIGGTSSEVSFAGSQGSLIGVDQVNIRIPRSLIGRGNADVILQADGKSANTVTINVK